MSSYLTYPRLSDGQYECVFYKRGYAFYVTAIVCIVLTVVALLALITGFVCCCCCHIGGGGGGGGGGGAAVGGNTLVFRSPDAEVGEPFNEYK